MTADLDYQALRLRWAERRKRIRERAIQQAKSDRRRRSVFTNQGTLTRVPFKVSRLMEFCTKRELVNQTGHRETEWLLVVLKELTDNALDECEEAGIAPTINIEVNGDQIIIADNGRGIPAKTIKGILNYSVRVSSREAYVSPTRGAQGNALKTILPMGYVLDERKGEDAFSETIIESHRRLHRIRFSVDHVRQEPKIGYTSEPSPIAKGTRITVQMPTLTSTLYTYLIDDLKERFLLLAEAYAWINPHLTLRVTWNGKTECDFKATDRHFSKWSPSWPTSAHWYDVSRFRRYMAAHIANRASVTVREFISEFDGMTATAKQKAVLEETGTAYTSLYDFFGRAKANPDNIAKLLASIQKHAREIKPKHLGEIGKEHFFRMMEMAGGDPKTFAYDRKFGHADGVPYVVECAFGVHGDGLTAGNAPHRKIITGVNWSPGINNPFKQIGSGGDSMDAILSELKANSSQPVMAVLHLACPRVDYTDRGKSAIVVHGGGRRADDGNE